jgi:hypothetical protein
LKSATTVASGRCRKNHQVIVETVSVELGNDHEHPLPDSSPDTMSATADWSLS